MILTDRFMYILLGHSINKYIYIDVYIYTITEIMSTQQTRPSKPPIHFVSLAKRSVCVLPGNRVQRPQPGQRRHTNFVFQTLFWIIKNKVRPKKYCKLVIFSLLCGDWFRCKALQNWWPLTNRMSTCAKCSNFKKDSKKMLWMERECAWIGLPSVCSVLQSRLIKCAASLTPLKHCMHDDARA